jgi:lysophospholipase L1-like esterase
MNGHWVTSWTAAPMNIWGPDAPLPGFFGQTLREIARLSVGGDAIVIRFTNEYGTRPIRLDSVRIAHAGEDGRIEPLTSREVTFDGSPSASIYPGSPLLTDPIDLPVRPLTRLAVSYYSHGHIPVETHHFDALQTTYVSVPGDFVDAGEMIVQQESTSYYLLSAILTRSPTPPRAVVCFGDSLTDSYGSSPNEDRRWPDILAERLSGIKELSGIAVLNQGIGGNRILHNGRGARALERFDRDVLGVSGASHVIVLQGINDIVWLNTVLAGPEQAVTAADLVAALQQIVHRAHLAGLKIMLGTITPFEGALPDFPNGGYFTADKERIRQSVNRHIRQSSSTDAMVDFDELLRDPSHPSRLHPKFDSGDHIHPSDAGYRAIAEAIDLAFLR